MKLFLLNGAVAFVAAIVSRPHYGDPNEPPGCRLDEVRAQLKGLDGDLCAAACTESGSPPDDCPTDVPRGVSAQPACVLHAGPLNMYCALTCKSDGECGPKASCKAASGAAICTYDDDQPPRTQHWAPVRSASFRDLQVVLSVAFPPNGTTGFAGAGTDGVGARVARTADGGSTWSPVWPAPNASGAFNLLLAAAARDDRHAVISGVFSHLFTVDGLTFAPSANAHLEPSNGASVLPDGHFGLVGSGRHNGVRLSPDGRVWTYHDLPANVSTDLFPARYGAFPTPTTWYVAAGNFPQQQGGGEASSRHAITSHWGIDAAGRLVRRSPVAAAADPVPCSTDPLNCYSAALFKTTDGGVTWAATYTSIDDGENVYPNGLHCASATHCVATLEGASCRLLVTRDGGVTWKEAMRDATTGCSLTDAHMIDESEGWVSGGQLVGDFQGRFWHTRDGGDTWDKEAVEGNYIFSFDMRSRTSGHAVGLDRSMIPTLWTYEATAQATRILQLDVD